jgi:hypothetical protein
MSEPINVDATLIQRLPLPVARLSERAKSTSRAGRPPEADCQTVQSL